MRNSRREPRRSIRIGDSAAPVWLNFGDLFRAIDEGNAGLNICLSDARLEEMRGQRTLFGLDRQILQHNLYGVDLNSEAVQICQLSLWIKTAARGKRLTSFDHTIREGNSIISDPAVHPKAFDWQAAFREVFAQAAPSSVGARSEGGFDVVVGNPPYIRQKLLSPPGTSAVHPNIPVPLRPCGSRAYADVRDPFTALESAAGFSSLKKRVWFEPEVPGGQQSQGSLVSILGFLKRRIRFVIKGSKCGLAYRAESIAWVSEQLGIRPQK